jgi:hypothetical protein
MSHSIRVRPPSPNSPRALHLNNHQKTGRRCAKVRLSSGFRRVGSGITLGGAGRRRPERGQNLPAGRGEATGVAKTHGPRRPRAGRPRGPGPEGSRPGRKGSRGPNPVGPVRLKTRSGRRNLGASPSTRPQSVHATVRLAANVCFMGCHPGHDCPLIVPQPNCERPVTLIRRRRLVFHSIIRVEIPRNAFPRDFLLEKKLYWGGGKRSECQTIGDVPASASLGRSRKDLLGLE